MFIKPDIYLIWSVYQSEWMSCQRLLDRIEIELQMQMCWLLSILWYAARCEPILWALVSCRWFVAQAVLDLVQTHLSQRAVHDNLVHEVASFYVVKLVEVWLTCNIFSFQKIVDAVYIFVFKGVDESWEGDWVLDDVSEHELYGPTGFHT